MSDASTQTITGNLTFDTAPELLAQSQSWFGAGAAQIVVDLAAAGRTDSAGIALLLEWIEMSRRQGLQIRFTNLPSQLREFIDANDLGTLFRQYTA